MENKEENIEAWGKFAKKKGEVHEIILEIWGENGIIQKTLTEKKHNEIQQGRQYHSVKKIAGTTTFSLLLDTLNGSN